MLDTTIRFFQEGGPFMYPIAVVLAIGLAITVERFFYLGSVRRRNRVAFEKGILPLLEKRDYERAMKAATSSNSAIASVMGAGLGRLLSNSRREDIEYAMEEGLMEVLPRLEKRTQYLATLANIATLLGLLGTIIGLIAAFTAVAAADPAQKASLLSESISVAMNTTAFGLMSAIPLLMFHAVLQTRTNEIVDSFEMAGVKLLNIVTEPAGRAAA
ncbi:Ferric siderophore transport system, biopolymer transport protein ExbB [Marinobacter nitratireducens]|uniref:Ferric siderophore transport system, biopolymer transport protein ExbB n=1 Tax=Marinobacter nitratireducens TaxID=1137280 RepID=A0A072N4T0_9GAMM|nr:MotA/TolQ/ExbB proton channel family protein [Marinobacter nitratireducens]KEF32267.1 Ferric siderophore transport system, biopolymer transport protein ExbB [Marinobacter nitratireducens]